MQHDMPCGRADPLSHLFKQSAAQDVTTCRHWRHLTTKRVCLLGKPRPFGFSGQTQKNNTLCVFSRGGGFAEQGFPNCKASPSDPEGPLKGCDAVGQRLGQGSAQVYLTSELR